MQFISFTRSSHIGSGHCPRNRVQTMSPFDLSYIYQTKGRFSLRDGFWPLELFRGGTWIYKSPIFFFPNTELNTKDSLGHKMWSSVPFLVANFNNPNISCSLRISHKTFHLLLHYKLQGWAEQILYLPVRTRLLRIRAGAWLDLL